MRKTKIIFVVGGLFSGIGKGVFSASLGNLFKNNGQKVFLQKHDPYLNVDAGLLSPSEHGEVFITKDGKECDLDLGTYERFTEQDTTQNSASTLGKLLFNLLSSERKGNFLGKTINFQDVETNLENSINETCAQEKPDVLIIEIGGSIADRNVFPYLRVAQNLRQKIGPNNFFFFFLTYLTYFPQTNEFKTRASQQSIEILRSYKIEPDFVVFRSENQPPRQILEKLSHYCRLSPQTIAILPNVPNIYRIPLLLAEQGIFTRLLQHFDWKLQLKNHHWIEFVKKFETAQCSSRSVKLAIINKYANFPLSYMSIFHSLNLAGAELNLQVSYTEISPEKLISDSKLLSTLKNFDGILIPGGYGQRGFEGKILAANYAREHQIPFFGLCFGMQASIVAFARYVLGIENANSAEFFAENDPKHKFLIVFSNYKGIHHNAKIGAYPVALIPNTQTLQYAHRYHSFAQKNLLNERFRHRLIFNPEYQKRFDQAGFLSVGFSHATFRSTEILELQNHPFYIGVQFHPEFNSRPNKPHFLFLAFLKAAFKNRSKKRISFFLKNSL